LLSTKLCREILGPKAEKLTDDQIEALYAQLSALAEVTIEMFDAIEESATPEVSH